MRLGKLATWAIGLAAMGFLAVSAQANSIIVSFNSSLSSGGTFVYDVSLDDAGGTNPQESYLVAQRGDYFTIYDFAGFTGGTWNFAVGALGDWTAPVQMLGITDPSVSPPDSPAILNVSIVYTGAVTGTIGTGAATSLPLGQLVLNSTYTQRVKGWYTSKDQQDFGGGLYGDGVQIATTTVPSPIPVPAALWGGLALLGLAGIRRAVRN